MGQEAGATTMKLIDFVKISAVAEGSGHNKAITLKNVGCHEVNLDEYKLILWSNTAKKGGAAFRANPTGRNNGVTQIPSGTTLAPGASYTTCHPKNTYTQECDLLSNRINHNGKKQDFLQLKLGDVLADSVGTRKRRRTRLATGRRPPSAKR